MSDPRLSDEPDEADAPLAGPPGWVKVLALIALAAILLFAVVAITGGPGDHGPGRHGWGGQGSGISFPGPSL